ncbi:asparagine synthase C-terminal domain-containing protein [Lujinxingia litoralis]|uniref:asparagine synthase-related protein n=1 Tax=Lujinxingia litoralis TaxID=2211119 RepID=UPI001315020B|nr:asparagine synthase C-terminal domain-containing protein [Lujinxingia litoralis]
MKARHTIALQEPIMGELYLGQRCAPFLPTDVQELTEGIWVRPGPSWGHQVMDRGPWHALIIGEPCALQADWGALLACPDDALSGAIAAVEGVHSGVAWRPGSPRRWFWRDRFGRIPWQLLSGHALLATTDPELVVRAAGSAGINPERLTDFLAGGRSTSRADFIRGVERLRPGELALADEERLHWVRRWWSPTLPTRHQLAPYHERLAQIGARLRLGTSGLTSPGAWLALSGGLDSATLLASSPDPRRCCAFTVTLRDAPAELATADTLTRALGTHWEHCGVDARWPLRSPAEHERLAGWGPHAHPDLAWFPAALNQLQAHCADQTPSVLYTGHGADDALWMPPGLWLIHQWDRGAWRELLAAGRALGARTTLAPARGALIERLGLRPWRERLRALPAPGPAWLPGAAGPARAALLSPMHRFALYRAARLNSWAWELIMRSLARIARRARLQVRTPYLDARIWDLALTLTPEELIEGGRQKAPLRRLTQGVLPEAVRTRKKLGSFDALVERGLAERETRRALRLFAGAQLAELRVIDGPCFQHALADYLSQPSRLWRGSWEIWRAVAAELWLHSRQRSSPPGAP